jgi:hypothetical protein
LCVSVASGFAKKNYANVNEPFLTKVFDFILRMKMMTAAAENSTASVKNGSFFKFQSTIERDV